MKKIAFALLKKVDLEEVIRVLLKGRKINRVTRDHIVKILDAHTEK